jgi:prolyl-tRNA synthetase
MRWSKIFIPTTRDEPAGAEAASHRLLLRAGYIRQITAGVYGLLPLAQRVRLKVINIIRSEMDQIGGQEFVLSALQPADLWRESGRYDSIDDIMFRLADRKKSELVLGLTHEESFTAIARASLNSYRQLPQIWYQIQTKFRDEARPKSGLLRVREFTMKDSYSFDVSEAGLDVSFQLHYKAYCNIFSRCGLNYMAVEASSGAMGGSQSTEFMVRTDAGEDLVAVCTNCGYSANLEKATSRITEVETSTSSAELERFDSPGIRTVNELAAFTAGAGGENQIKSLVYAGAEGLVLALVRGDHDLNVSKLEGTLKQSNLRAATAPEIEDAMGALPGSLGGVGVKAGPANRIKLIVADESIKGRTNMFTGANCNDMHYRNVSIERDITVDTWADIRAVAAGERCKSCDDGKLDLVKTLEIGHIFKLGTRYSESMGANVLLEDGSRIPIIMGSYGIGVERLMAAVAESSHDSSGIIWPPSIAPFHVVITPVNNQDAELKEHSENLYAQLQAAGVDVILDDRDDRAGVKFNDAELVGIPYRITVGKKIKSGMVELFTRATKSTEEIAVTAVCDELAVRLKEWL